MLIGDDISIPLPYLASGSSLYPSIELSSLMFSGDDISIPLPYLASGLSMTTAIFQPPGLKWFYTLYQSLQVV